MDNNIKQNTNFSNNVKQFELNEAKKKMGIQQAEWKKPANQQQLTQSKDSNQQEFNTLF